MTSGKDSVLRIRTVSAAEVGALAPGLAALFQEAVNGGASLGFLPPIRLADAREYLLSLRPELESGSRLLLVAFQGPRLVGAGQLYLVPWSNAPHRAELQKLFVAEGLRGRGLGARLVDALHTAARSRGRTLVVLNTRAGDAAERFYRKLGYTEAGVVPGYTRGPAGERYANLTLYREL